MNLVDEYDPVLRLRSPEFSFQGSLPEERQRLVDDMFETMFANNGIGLAAPQVGISTRLFVMASTQYGNIVCYNPEVKVASDELANGVEGCLSFPDLQLSIKRAILITGKFQDVTGKEVELTFEELDHLDGVVFTTKVGPTTLQLARQRQSKQKRTKRK
jgi:peptide deformylase